MSIKLVVLSEVSPPQTASILAKAGSVVDFVTAGHVGLPGNMHSDAKAIAVVKTADGKQLALPLEALALLSERLWKVEGDDVVNLLTGEHTPDEYRRYGGKLAEEISQGYGDAVRYCVLERKEDGLFHQVEEGDCSHLLEPLPLRPGRRLSKR